MIKNLERKRRKRKFFVRTTYNTNNNYLKTNRSLSPLNANKRISFKNKNKKVDKINLSRNILNDEAIISLVQQIKNSKDKLKEIKLIKCGINNEGAALLLKALEHCVKLNFINFANTFSFFLLVS